MIKAVRQWFIVFIIGCSLIFSVRVFASTQSEALIHQGVLDLQQQGNKDALQKFEAAAKADPTDSQALFFQGATLNRMARYKEALVKLQQAEALKCRHREMSFELGWSLTQLERWQEAAQQLEKYEQIKPGRGQTSEFLGRAYLGLKQYERAEAALQEAVRRDPNLKPTVDFYMFVLKQQTNKPEEAKKYLQEVTRELPNSPIARAVKQMEQGLPPSLKPWHLSLSVGGGYNSNVINLGDDINVPSDISNNDAVFGHYTFTSSYDWRLGSKDVITAGYNFQADVYDSIADANLLDHLLFANYSHAFKQNFIGALRFTEEFTQLGGANFRNQIALQPALIYRFTDWLATELNYTPSYGNYNFKLPPVQNRSGVANTLGFSNYFRIPKIKANMRFGYFHAWNNAKGEDFQFKSNGVFVGLQQPLPWKVTADFLSSIIFYRYDNSNSLAGDAGFEYKRKDDVYRAGIQFTRPICPWAKAYARYDFTRDDSNIIYYKYTQNVVTSGVVFDF